MEFSLYVYNGEMLLREFHNVLKLEKVKRMEFVKWKVTTTEQVNYYDCDVYDIVL